MNKDESAKILAVYFVYDSKHIKLNEKIRRDLADISIAYGFCEGEVKDEEVNGLFVKYRRQLEEKGKNNPPHWAKLIMSERYSIHI